MRLTLVLATALLVVPKVGGAQTPLGVVYDADGAHLWNRLFRTFYVRRGPDGTEYGGDVLDPYLWRETRHLVSDSSGRAAERVLGEFLANHGERLVTDPGKRAMLQRDMLGVYDWLVQPGADRTPTRGALTQLVSRVIERLAMSSAEIAALPSSLTLDPALLDVLADTSSGWVCLGRADSVPVARTHLQAFGGRSTFVVFLNVPGGRAATRRYLAQLRSIPTGWRPDPQRVPTGGPPIDSPALRSMSIPFPNPPEIPPGTRVALVRFANLVDTRGDLRPTRIVESVQLREYGVIPPGPVGIAEVGRTPYQRVFEAELSRRALFGHEGAGLRILDSTARGHGTFMTHGDDVFESSLSGLTVTAQREHFAGFPVLRSCGSCHEAVGLPSFISYSRERFDSGVGPPPKLGESTVEREAARQIDWLVAHGIGFRRMH